MGGGKCVAAAVRDLDAQRRHGPLAACRRRKKGRNEGAGRSGGGALKERKADGGLNLRGCRLADGGGVAACWWGRRGRAWGKGLRYEPPGGCGGLAAHSTEGHFQLAHSGLLNGSRLMATLRWLRCAAMHGSYCCSYVSRHGGRAANCARGCTRLLGRERRPAESRPWISGQLGQHTLGGCLTAARCSPAPCCPSAAAPQTPVQRQRRAAAPPR